MKKMFKQLPAGRNTELNTDIKALSSVKCFSIKGSFYFTQFQSFQAIQTYHHEVIMESMIAGDWLLELTHISPQMCVWAEK